MGGREGRGFIGAAIDGGVLSGGTGGEGVHCGSHRWRGRAGRGFIGEAIDGRILSGGTGGGGVHLGSHRWRGPEWGGGGGGGGSHRLRQLAVAPRHLLGYQMTQN